MTPDADLIVIGAGWAGLYAAKYALAAGLDVRILEGREDIGGVWNYSDDPDRITVMRNTVSSSSRHVTEASDCSMGAEAGTFFTHEEAMAFLRRYAERFGLTDRIVTGAKVAKAEKQDEQWRLTTADGREFRSARIAVATGLHQRRRPITGPIADFTGTLIHAGDIKHPLEMGIGEGDHVVVYGGGETAADIVHDLAANTSAEITWSIRGGQHFFRKAPLRPGNPPGVYDRYEMALDEYSSVILGVLTSAPKGTPGMRYHTNLGIAGSVFAYQGHGIAEWTNDVPQYRQFFNKNGHAVEHAWNGRITPARGVERCEGDEITFTDGRTVRATHVICTFGYLPDFSYLPESITAVPTHKMHKLVFHPEDPTVCFFGFIRPMILSLPYIVELQCLYAARVWSGAVTLPGVETRRHEAETDAASLNALLGYERTNRNIVCPFWYLEVMMKAMELDGYRRLFDRFDPRKDWTLFSKVVRLPATPLLLRFIAAEFGEEERRRMDEYLSPMPIGFRRQANVSLVRYVLTFGLVIGLARLVRLDDLFDWIARRRIARTGRAIPLRPMPTPVDRPLPVPGRAERDAA